MQIDPQSILNAILGGALIGLAASLLLIVNGRIAGISVILGRLVTLELGGLNWRTAFLVGLLSGGGLVVALQPEMIQVASGRSLGELILAGLLVGIGVRMADGCTSGHGVCGLSRFSKRSLVATLTFMATGFLTATAIHMMQGLGP